MFQLIVRRALEIWQLLGGGETSAQRLVTQYDAFEVPYNTKFIDSVESPFIWWIGCKQPQHQLALHKKDDEVDE